VAIGKAKAHIVTVGNDRIDLNAIVRRQKKNQIRENWELYLLVALPVLWLLIFMYWPMYGNIIAFKRFVPALGIWGSEWAGFANFERFFTSFRFGQILWNTVALSLYQLLVQFPIPIFLAILIHYCPLPRYKKTVQLISYAPHFISVVVITGIIFKLLAPGIGIVPVFLESLGIQEPNFLGSARWFRDVYVWSEVWQRMGWGSIIYLAALASVDPELYEAARVDGASIWQRIRHIDLPGIAPTIIILLILQAGRVLNVGFEKVLLLQNNLNLTTSEVIQTYVYKVGLAGQVPNPSYATAIGLFQNVLSFLLLIMVNRIAKKVGETSLW
jgi:ABC-type polysaccharide transport system permease subunit